MTEISSNLFIAKELEVLRLDFLEYSLVSLANTYHYRINNWSYKIPHKLDPCYVICGCFPGILSLNWVDGPAKYYDYNGQGVQVFNIILQYIKDELRDSKKVVIMCNQAESRSPSVALLHLAKVIHQLPDDSYSSAAQEFRKLYPRYNPKGIKDFLASNWQKLGK